MKNILPIIVVIVIISGVSLWWNFFKNETPLPTVTNFEECVAAGNPVMESYPRQCRAGEQTFTENIGNELEKTDLIRIDSPRPNQIISNPLTITGQARGNWFFEASFPVTLTDWDGKIIAEGIATAQSEWMTSDFVPFEATLTFVVDKDVYSNRGFLILQKDNPSGLPEHDDALEIPVIFAGVNEAVTPSPVACTMEAKICPDGSAVGRTGPKCEFAACPDAGDNVGILPYNSGIQGIVMSGPTCPVMQYPPDPKCDDKPIMTNISVYRSSDTSRSIAMLESGEDGTFSVSLPPGEYVVMAGSFGVPFPRCSDTNVTVGTSGYSEITVSCDTGIR